ncbi:MAG: hypothetical protein OXG72_21310, partial [Acidobacteria bacterium]|nr:hypothetical protein [Acidobacteriota bacterium]
MRIVLRFAETAFGHRGLDLRPARRIGVDHFAGDARDLEAPVGMGFLDPVAEIAETPRQLRPVDRP